MTNKKGLGQALTLYKSHGTEAVFTQQPDGTYLSTDTPAVSGAVISQKNRVRLLQFDKVFNFFFSSLSRNKKFSFHFPWEPLGVAGALGFVSCGLARWKFT